jgi:hypothetical protein
MSTTPRRTTGLRQFLNLEQQRNWIEGKTNLSDADERSESLEQRLKYVARFQKLLRRPQAQGVLEILRSTAKTASQSRARPSVTTGRFLVCHRPPTSRSSALMRAGWSFSRSMRTARASAQDSWCIFQISPRTIHPRRAMWTNPFSSNASRRQKGSVISFRAARTFSASMCGATPRSANSSRPAACCAPFGLSI